MKNRKRKLTSTAPPATIKPVATICFVPYNRRLHFFLWIASFLLYGTSLVQCQFDGFEPTVEPCPSDDGVSGYTSIQSLNTDIETELSRIQDGGAPQELYFILLCPGTFDTSEGPLLPRLDQAAYSCGGTGDVNDGCIFSGGEQNIRIEDPGIEGYTVNGMNFMGITFTAFTGYSIEASGIAPTEAIFMNCQWEDFNAAGIARISNEDGNAPMDLQFDMCSIISTTGEPSQAVVDVAFENIGGAVSLSSVLVEGVQVDNSIFRTTENGATIVFNSEFNANLLSRLSETVGGLSEFSGITVTNNEDIVRIFEADGDGSSTVVQDSIIEQNIGILAYQIFRVTDGAQGSLLNATIRFNNPVEYGMYVLADTEGTEPSGLIEDSLFEGNTQEDWALVMSEGVGAYVEMARNRFVENTGGLMNLGAFFGGEIKFTQTCFERNEHFLVALILEFSTFSAFDNYVNEEVSQICSGMDETQGTGRLSVEQPGSMCFRGGDECLVDCLPNANDSPVCLADAEVGSPTPSPSSSTVAPTATQPSTSNPTSVGSEISTSSPTLTVDCPPDPPTISPTENPSKMTPIPTLSPPTTPPLPPVPSSPTYPPFEPVPSQPRPPSLRPTMYQPTMYQPPTYRPPKKCSDKAKLKGPWGYYYDYECIKETRPPYVRPTTNKSPKKSKKSSKEQSKWSSGSKSFKSEKKSKKSSKASSSYSNDYEYNYNHPPQNYGIGSNPSTGHYQESNFGIGNSYSQPRTTATGASTGTNHHGIGNGVEMNQGYGHDITHRSSTNSSSALGEQEAIRNYGIGHTKK